MSMIEQWPADTPSVFMEASDGNYRSFYVVASQTTAFQLSCIPDGSDDVSLAALLSGLALGDMETIGECFDVRIFREVLAVNNVMPVNNAMPVNSAIGPSEIGVPMVRIRSMRGLSDKSDNLLDAYVVRMTLDDWNKISAEIQRLLRTDM